MKRDYSKEILMEHKSLIEKTGTLPNDILDVFPENYRELYIYILKNSDNEFFELYSKIGQIETQKYAQQARELLNLHFRKVEKISCFSEKVDSMTMWSHYANSIKVSL